MVDLARYLGKKGEVDAIGSESGTWKKNGISLFKTSNGSYRYVYSEDGLIVSVLQVMSRDGSSGQVANAFTRPDFRKKKIATKLWKKAQKDFKSLRHSDDLSNDAKAWIKTLQETKQLKKYYKSYKR